MNSILATAILTAFEQLLKLAPALIIDLQAIFSKTDPTGADWQALKDKVSSRDYWSYVKDSDLPRPTDATKPQV